MMDSLEEETATMGLVALTDTTLVYVSDVITAKGRRTRVNAPSELSGKLV